MPLSCSDLQRGERTVLTGKGLSGNLGKGWNSISFLVVDRKVVGAGRGGHKSWAFRKKNNPERIN